MYQPANGVGVLVTLLVFLFFTNWLFRFDFEVAAGRRGTILEKDREAAAWRSFCGVLLFAVILLLIWQAFGLRVPRMESSPQGVVKAGYQLLTHSEIYWDMGFRCWN
jgi:hypothetical protein